MICFESHAKINIGLKITGRRSDGYHTLQTIFQEISLADTITLERKDHGCELVCDNPSIPTDKTNLCAQAYQTLKASFLSLGGVRITLEKRIPVGAGLGGGSSNAAAVLRGMNKLYDLRLSKQQLEEIALSIGADVPFFIGGGTQYATGIGEVLFPATLPPMGTILLVIPDIQISSAWAYGEVNNRLTGGLGTGKFAVPFKSLDLKESARRSAIEWGRLADKFLENDFEALVFQTYPEIGEIKRQLFATGAQFASLSGSGSTVFGIFPDEAHAAKAQKQFPPSLQTLLVLPVTR